MRMKNKVAVITGGASGIGKRTVERFVEEGGRAVIADIQDDPALQMYQDLGSSVQFSHCDVTIESNIADAIRLAYSTWGRLDLMFNNAGRPSDPSPIETLSAENWDGAMNVLLRSVMFGIKHAAPVMKRQGFGAIVSTASIAGLIAGSTGTPYCVAKAGVIHLTKCAALELADSGIRVNCICPGMIPTPIFARVVQLPAQLDQLMVEKVTASLSECQPLSRDGRPDDIAEAVLYLADDRAGFITGVILPVDGGVSAGMSPVERHRFWAKVRAAMADVAQGVS